MRTFIIDFVSDDDSVVFTLSNRILVVAVDEDSAISLVKDRVFRESGVGDIIVNEISEIEENGTYYIY
jgi:hypothetical protein